MVFLGDVLKKRGVNLYLMLMHISCNVWDIWGIVGKKLLFNRARQKETGFVTYESMTP